MGRYNITDINQGRFGRNYFKTKINQKPLQKDSDTYVITQEGDRLDNLAYHFYGSPHMWHIIANANDLVLMTIKAGKRLRIPRLG